MTPLRNAANVVSSDVGVQNVDEVHPGVARHPLAIRTDGRKHRRTAVGRTEPIRAAGDHDACRQPLEVPLPRCGQRLVEVVGVEHKAPLRRREEPEVGQVGIAAGLHQDVGPGRRLKVERHHGGRTTVIGEGRLGHSRMAQFDEIGKAIRLLCLENGDRIAGGLRLEVGVARAREVLARETAPIRPLRSMHPRSRLARVP